MSSIVLDASALLALLRSEVGSDIVTAALPRAVISSVNYAEVLEKTLERGGQTDAVAHFIRALAISIIPFDEDQAAAVADLHAQTKQEKLSFAALACLALASLRRAKLITADQVMGRVQLPVKVRLIRHGL